MPVVNETEQLKLIEILRDTIKKDAELREKYNIGNKFRFVSDRLNELFATLERATQETTSSSTNKPTEEQNTSDEVFIYIYLYNTQGILLRSWQNMLTPKFLYEFGFNRPIYAEREHIDALLKSKSNKVQHSYLTVAVKQRDILPASPDAPLKDALGNPIVKN